MTCTEVRQMTRMFDFNAVLDMTRGERAAVANHMDSCQDCHTLMNRLASEEPVPSAEIAVATDAIVDALLATDYSDPEYVKSRILGTG